MLEARLVEQEETRIAEPLQLHSLFSLDRPEQVNLKALLALEKVASVLSLIREFVDIFALSHVDMASFLPELAEHQLSLQKGYKPIRERLR